MRPIVKNILYTACITAAFASGLQFTVPQPSTTAPRRVSLAPKTVPTSFVNIAQAHAGGEQSLPPTETFFAVLNTVRRDFYSGKDVKNDSRIASRRLTYAAIDGMLLSLKDRYTEYWTPEEFRANMEETRGNFVGIGATLDESKDGRVFILRPIENSPASRAGLLTGDIIAAVNNESVTGQDVAEVIDRIRGKENTPVRLTIERKTGDKPFTVTLMRALVQAPVIESRMVDEAARIGYVKLDMFTEQANRQFGTALTQLEKQNLRALIFDLRNNPGGLLNVAQDLASRFLDKGAVVWVREKNGKLSSLDVDKGQHQGKLSTGAYPVIVLVNGNSASASEIVCGAIQDAGRGQILGTRTFGKGLVQTIIPLGDESAVKITTQHYYTRNKHDINRHLNWQGEPIDGSGGVLPDIPVEFTDKDAERQRDAVRADPRNLAVSDRLDPQMNRALELLRGRLTAKTAKPIATKLPTPVKQTARR